MESLFPLRGLSALLTNSAVTATSGVWREPCYVTNSKDLPSSQDELCNT
jgi:hypothetical protein